ncbi:MAG: endo-alpha-N-acetylgalactosaminidase family protein [Kineothrix sp.]
MTKYKTKKALPALLMACTMAVSQMAPLSAQAAESALFTAEEAERKEGAELAGAVQAAGQPEIPTVTNGEGETQTEETAGRKWFRITGGTNNGGGHNYGNAGVSAPILLLDNTRRMEESGELSLTLKPSNNWGVFYSYVDDSKWLYVGYDSSSQWYYQYKFGTTESYPRITGLPAPTQGEELQMTVSLNRETLSVTVNGTTVRVTNQALINFAEAVGSNGRFGVKTNGQSSISFADVRYNNTDCMSDEWVFCAEREGQQKSETVAPLFTLTGTVKNGENQPIPGAVVRVGVKSAVADESGAYSLSGLEAGEYTMAVTKPGYQAYSETVTIAEPGEGGAANTKDVVLQAKPDLPLDRYDTIQSDEMKVYIGKQFPLVARYQMLENGQTREGVFFRGNEGELNQVAINGAQITPVVTVEETTATSRTYVLQCTGSGGLSLTMKVKISVEGNDLTWQVTELTKGEGCPAIATIHVPGLNLLTVDAAEENAGFAGAKTSTTTTVSGDEFIDFEEGFAPMDSDGYLYGFLQNGSLSAGLFSNSEAEGDKRVLRSNGADTISLNSAAWYYELGDRNGQNWINARENFDTYPVSELPCAKVAIAADANGDGDIDWNDGALAFRDIMNIPYGSEKVKDAVNHRIVMNFASMAPNPFLATADNIKKVYLATDGLPQSVVLKGYGNEGHDSANSEYADIAEREGGVEDFQDLIRIAHDYNTEIGIHINAQEAYPEAASFHEEMLENPIGNGWGWLDQSHVIDKRWDLASQARWKRLVQLYDRINGTSFYSRQWPDPVLNSLGEVTASREEIRRDAESREDNMDFIYLDVWYQDSWETRRIAEEFRTLGWRFTTEFSAEGEYDSTWQHWSTDAVYGGATSKGFNSSIIRFIRNDQRDSQVLNYPSFGGAADNPLLGGYRLYGFEGWQGDQNFDNYIRQTFNQNLPTRFLQHYYVTDWENYGEGETSPVGNQEKQITLKNDEGDVVVVTRKTEQRTDENIERIITLNGKKVLEDVTYLLPWTDNDDGTLKLYHWNLEGGTTTWELPAQWSGVSSVVMYELSDQGRIHARTVEVSGGQVTLTAEAATAYVVVRDAGEKTLKAGFGERDYVADPGFNGYEAGESLSAEDWSGDIGDEAVVVEKASTGDQRLAFNSPEMGVAVTTAISGLKPGTDYVAEVNVENNSDAAASITVDAGEKTVSNYTGRSILANYVQCDPKHNTKMQRMQISFTAEADTAQLTLAREAGEGSTYMDDIRIVEKSLDNFKQDGSFEQDFETVVQGIYPFVLSSAQGVSDPRTHLSQKHEPYTQKGWNGRIIDDVIDGEWSLKHHCRTNGIVYQTLPQTFRFEPGKVYQVEFDYQSGPNQAYAVVVGNGTDYTAPQASERLPQATTTQHVEMEVTGAGNGQTWIGLYMNSTGVADNVMGGMDFVLDNLVIREKQGAVAATLDKETLYKGETANILGSSLEQITWTSSAPGVAEVDKAASKVKALSAGTATLTAALPDGSTLTFTVTVKEEVISEISANELGEVTATANTAETQHEQAGAEKAVDGNSGTFWHSQYSAPFTVSLNNPAVLTIDLGRAVTMGGFKFQQRPSANNGRVQRFSYRILAEDGSELAAGSNITVSEADQANGAWVYAFLSEAKTGRYIEISVVQGRGNFAAIAEVAPIRVERLAETATLENQTLDAGSRRKLVPSSPEGTVVKGLVWTSSDEKIATVDKNGVITAIKPGSATITAANAVGLTVQCTVTVTEAETVDYGALQKAIQAAEKTELSKYQDGAEKTAFTRALSEAKRVLEERADQAAADAAAEALTKAQAALKPVAADPKPQPKPWPFSDIPVNSGWKYDNAKYVYDNDIMNGISGTNLFDPDGKLNRAMFATVLYRMAGNPSIAFENKFTDVKDGQYYSKAIIWANRQGIVQGFTDGSYGVTTNITREQIAKMLYEYAAKAKYDVSGAASLDSFTDKDKVSHWAVNYMKWAVDTGMISGKPNGDGSYRLDPKGEATRAECAKMLTMFMKEYQPR